jgi:hypothetical protein
MKNYIKAGGSSKIGNYIKAVAIGPALDPDAAAFITAAGITDPTQQSAINTLVLDMKGYGIWTKMKAVYPFVGGTATTHKWNLKDPQDTNAAFRLVFNGGWTHSSTGALPNGTNGYADTFLNTSTSLSLASASFGIYNRVAQTIAGGNGAIGSGSPTSFFHLFPKYANVLYGNVNTVTGHQFTNTDDKKFFQISRNSASVIDLLINTTLTTGSFASGNIITANFYLGARNSNPGVSYYGNPEFAFAYLGNGLTTTEMTDFYTAVQAFNTTLSRQV